MPWLTRKLFHDWPQDANDLPPGEVQRLYEAGFAGAKSNPEAWERFKSEMPHPDGEAVAHEFGLADTGAGKLTIPFVFVLEMFPGCWPGQQGQGRGDCVSWSTRNAALLTMCCDIVSGLPDEKTGKPEQAPEVPDEGIADGVLSTESFYWYRGYNGDGWDCPTAATVACKKSGLMVRKPYTDLGFDLTSYSAKTAGLYGSKAPGAAIQTEGGLHLVHQGTRCDEFEPARDLLYNGNGVTTCGGEGFSSSRNEDGVSTRQGSWSHAYLQCGVDDRDVIKAKYGEPLELWLNSWAKWNSGGRDIYQSASLVPPGKKEEWIRKGIVNPTTGNIMIPEGAWWAKASQSKNRDRTAFSGALGWVKKSLPLDWYV